MNPTVSGETVKQLRLARGWSQEQLAALCDRNVRTIQRVEKNGTCDLETRGALAAVFEVDIAQLSGDRKIEQTKAPGGHERLYYVRLTEGSQIVATFDGAFGYRFTNEEPRSKDDAEAISAAVSRIHEYAEIWAEIEPGQRVTIAHGFADLLKELEKKGIWVFGLLTRQQLAINDAAEPMNVRIANFHLTYDDSGEIIVLDPKKGTA